MEDSDDDGGGGDDEIGVETAAPFLLLRTYSQSVVAIVCFFELRICDAVVNWIARWPHCGPRKTPELIAVGCTLKRLPS